ncbi:MAG TPA: SDR family oxidoreductase [Gemmatimonadales bacterium]|nr:SDR family oxidoreductase [Gemmatimonadales bacterium]
MKRLRVLITGHNGYIGSVMTRLVQAAGHEVTGLDTYYFDRCTLGAEEPDIPARRIDVRDVRETHVAGFDAIIHLAALSNDPLGNLHAETTYAINHAASVQLAHAAKAAGVPRFLFASSCSLYGVAGDAMLTEEAAFNPITPYGESKVLVERDVRRLADERFTPVFLRNATAYGASPRLRLDIVVNNLVGAALTTGEILVQSDGTPWRPLVHVEDFSRAFLAALHAPRDLVHNEAFNVGRTSENYRVSELAELVRQAVPGTSVRYAEGGGPDPRSYRVNCDKLARTLPEYRPAWTVPQGIAQLVAAYRAAGMTRADFTGARYLRIRRIQELQAAGRLDAELRWTGRPAATPQPATATAP